MPILDVQQTAQVRDILQQRLRDPVHLVYFTQALECTYCKPTEELLQEIAALDERIKLTVHNFQLDREAAERYQVDKIPALVILDAQDVDRGIRFYGIPSGFEFDSLLHALILVSTGATGFSPELEQRIRRLRQPAHIQVFVTPTCPYCPAMVQLAHKLAYLHPKIRGDMIEAMEFPHLAQRYMVRGVPKTVVNEVHSVEGMVPDQAFIAQLEAWLEEPVKAGKESTR